MIPGRRGFMAGSLLLAGSARGQDTPKTLRLGVVDLRSCLKPGNYTRMTEVVTEISGLREYYKIEIQRLQDVLSDKTRRMQALPKGSKLRVEKDLQRGHAAYDLESAKQVAPVRIRNLAVKMESRALDDVQRTVAAVARDLGLDLVLRAEEFRPGDPKAVSYTSPLQQAILYHDSALDITRQVTDRLNADWKSAWACAECKTKTLSNACPDCGAKQPK